MPSIEKESVLINDDSFLSTRYSKRRQAEIYYKMKMYYQSIVYSVKDFFEKCTKM